MMEEYAIVTWQLTSVSVESLPAKEVKAVEDHNGPLPPLLISRGENVGMVFYNVSQIRVI